MSKLLHYLSLTETLYFIYGILFLQWTPASVIWSMILALLIYYPFGVIYILMADGIHKAKAIWKHIGFFGASMLGWAFIVLVSPLSQIANADWNSSAGGNEVMQSIKTIIVISVTRHILNVVFEKILKVRRTVTEAFYIGIWKLVFIFAIMWPYMTILIIFNEKGAQYFGLLVTAIYVIWDMKGFGRKMPEKDIQKIGKQMGFIDT